MSSDRQSLERLQSAKVIDLASARMLLRPETGSPVVSQPDGEAGTIHLYTGVQIMRVPERTPASNCAEDD